MKIYSLRANENWICDRFVDEWETHNPDIVTQNPYESNILWLVASWAWNRVPVDLLQHKKVVATVHHLDLEKFDENAQKSFFFRDQFVDVYHVPCKLTADQISPYTEKPIWVQPFWVNQNVWHKIESKNLRADVGLSNDKFLIGSFQRDTEGHDLVSPKLSKGPDIFCDVVEQMHEKNNDVEVVLAGWRRQYVINRLKTKKINYHYFEWADFDLLNKLYNCLDLYLVSSRCEGGPQAIPECAITQTPIISTRVGLADRILAPESVFDLGGSLGKPNTDVALSKVQEYLLPQGFQPFRQFFDSVK